MPARAVLCVLLQELKEQKEELLTKVQALKTDLQDWRTKLEAQVKNYKSVSVTAGSRWPSTGLVTSCAGLCVRQSSQ